MRPHRWKSTRLHCPWDSPGKNTGVGCHFLLQCMKMKVKSLSLAQSCLTFSDTMDCSLPGSYVHGIFQARILEWVAMPSSRDGTMEKLKIGKGLHQGYILSPCLFNFYAEYIMWNAGLDESQAGIKTVDDHPNGRKWRGTKESLDEGKRGKWKSWLKIQHSRH